MSDLVVHTSRQPARRRWPIWPYQTFLAILFLGPIIAPLFQATRLPFVADTGALARDLLASYICPTPAKSYMLLGFPMGVCARCWGATIGLWLAWFAVRGVPRWEGFAAWWARFCALAWPLRFLLAALPFGLWVAEIGWWPAAPYAVLLLNGALAGVAAGLFFCSVWPGMRDMNESAQA